MEKFKIVKEKIPDQPEDAEKRLSGKMAGERGEGFIELSDSKENFEDEKKRETREEWEKKLDEISGLYEQVSKRSHEDPEFSRKVLKERQEFNYVVISLPKEYGRPQDYMAFHNFVGGTSDYENSPKADLPGKYSIAGFYQRCINNDFPIQEWRY